MENTIEQAIRTNAEKFGLAGSEFIVSVQLESKKGIHVLIRPANRDGETFEFIVSGNLVQPILL